MWNQFNVCPSCRDLDAVIIYGQMFYQCCGTVMASFLKVTESRVPAIKLMNVTSYLTDEKCFRG